MPVTSVNYDDKVQMYGAFTFQGGTLTAIGEDFEVSRKTVRRCVDEVERFLNERYVGETLVYNDQRVVISKIDEPKEDILPIAVKFGDGVADYIDLAQLMEDNLAGLEPVKPVVPYGEPEEAYSVPADDHSVTASTGLKVGDEVYMSPESKYVLRGWSQNPVGVKGVITESFEGCYIVDWSNGDVNNSYTNKDLIAAEDYEAEVVEDEVVEDEDADYFVVAPQDSISIVRVDKDSGEIETRNINRHAESFAEIRAMIVESQDKPTLQKAFTLMSVRGIVEAFSMGRVKVDPEGESVVFIKPDGSERPVPQDIATDIISTIKEYGVAQSEKLVRFLDKLMDNVSFKAIEGLYRFMTHHCIEINEDGSIQAWKGVARDLYSVRSGEIKSSETITVGADGRVWNGDFGKEIRVDRSEVDDDPDNGCSHGLHLGSHSYARSWGEILLKVRVEPQDVVAVPKVYSNNDKMRCCAYVPIGTVEK